MKIPIPQDWDGQTWACFQIEWPDSPEWIGFLMGLLTYAQRGRVWDENTGSILDVQAIGREIFSRNYPFTDCEGETQPETQPCDWSVAFSTFDDSESEDCEDMPAVTWISIEDEKLYMWFGPCCKIEVEGDLGTVINPPPGPPTGDPVAGYSCNKAYGMAVWWADILVTGLTALLSPGDYRVTWKTALPQYVWTDVELSAAMSTYLYNFTEIDALRTDANLASWLACLWESALENTNSLTYEEFLTMQAVLPTHFSAVQTSFIKSLMMSIGSAEFGWLAKATYATEGNCTCPGDDSVGPTPTGWYLGPEIAQQVSCPGGFGYGVAFLREIASHAVYGAVFGYRHKDANPINRLKRNNSCGSTPAPDFCHTVSNSDNHALETTYCQMANGAYAEISPLVTSPVQINQVGKVSDSPASPVVTVGQVHELPLAGQRQGDETDYVLIEFWVRFLHNTNEP